MKEINVTVHREDIISFLDDYCYFCRKQGIVGSRNIPFKMWSVFQLLGTWRRGGTLTEDQREKVEEDLREILGNVQVMIKVK